MSTFEELAAKVYPSMAAKPSAGPEWGSAEWFAAQLRQHITKHGEADLGGGLLVRPKPAEQSPAGRLWPGWK